VLGCEFALYFLLTNKNFKSKQNEKTIVCLVRRTLGQLKRSGANFADNFGWAFASSKIFTNQKENKARGE
jgi:hypothetical protein